MKAMVLDGLGDLRKEQTPLKIKELPTPIPGQGEILVKVTVCGVCHTELDEIEGRTSPSRFPMVLGHQVVGQVIENGPGANQFQTGDRVGIAWIFSSCGKCQYCIAGDENLCPEFKATGRDANGGYAEYMVIQDAFAFPIPETFTDIEAAPHLCAGAIGYRSLHHANLQDGETLGLTGFGASAHLVLKLVKFQYPNTKVFVFSRTPKERDFALSLGAVWAGDITATAPELLNSIIDTTPVWKPVVEALRNLAPGGRLVINAIRKEKFDQDYLLKLDYPTHLWMEKEIKSVANVSRRDVSEYLKIAARIHIKPEIQEFSLEDANRALVELKTRKIRGAKILRIG